MASMDFARRRHSFLASGSSHLGQDGAFFTGFGSFSFSFLLPGLPSSNLIAEGVGFRPLVINTTSQKTAAKKDLRNFHRSCDNVALQESILQ